MFITFNCHLDQVFLYILDKYIMCNLTHHHTDFQIEDSWTSRATGHEKGPCDTVDAVVKPMATQHLLKTEPSASCTSPKEFFQWCIEKNNQMVLAKPRSAKSLTSGTIRVPEPNRPNEVRWLPADFINDE